MGDASTAIPDDFMTFFVQKEDADEKWWDCAEFDNLDDASAFCDSETDLTGKAHRVLRQKVTQHVVMIKRRRR